MLYVLAPEGLTFHIRYVLCRCSLARLIYTDGATISDNAADEV